MTQRRILNMSEGQGPRTLETDEPMAIENDVGPRRRVDRVLQEAGCRDATAIRPCDAFHNIVASRKGTAMQTTSSNGGEWKFNEGLRWASQKEALDLKISSYKPLSSTPTYAFVER